MAEEVYFLYIEKLGCAPKQARDLLRFSKSINKPLSWKEAGKLVKNPPNSAQSSTTNKIKNNQFLTKNTLQITELLNTVQSTKSNANTYMLPSKLTTKNEQKNQVFRLNWFHIYNAIKHELYDTIASSFMDIINNKKNEYQTVNNENINKILTDLKQKRNNPNEIEYIKALIERAKRFHSLFNGKIITYQKNDGISNDDKFEELLCDIYNTHNCFLFIHYQFTH
eukprot:14445_1